MFLRSKWRARLSSSLKYPRISQTFYRILPLLMLIKSCFVIDLLQSIPCLGLNHVNYIHKTVIEFVYPSSSLYSQRVILEKHSRVFCSSQLVRAHRRLIECGVNVRMGCGWGLRGNWIHRWVAINLSLPRPTPFPLNQWGRLVATADERRPSGWQK